MSCPDEETLLAFVDGTLAPTRRAQVEEHIDACTTCALLLADAARDLTQLPVPDDADDWKDVKGKIQYLAK